MNDPSDQRRRQEAPLLRYWIDCVEAEAVSSLVLPVQSSSHVLLESGSEPAITASPPSRMLPAHEHIDDWLTQRQDARQTDVLYGGWPLVTGSSPVDGQQTRPVVAPLFLAPIRASTHPQGGWLVERLSAPEVSRHALTLLGVGSGELDELVDALDGLDGTGPGAAWAAHRLHHLATIGIIPRDVRFDNSCLEPLSIARTGAAVCNTALLFVGGRAVFNQNLIRDLEELAVLDDGRLREGPLGAILGHVAVPPAPPPVPQPSLLPTTLSQDHAITSASTNVLTVVTGPPGTGKSQVLVNAVAAATARGESVLFASKNNSAVDVVFERLRAASDTVVPIRAGRAGLRREVAATMAEALARPHTVTANTSAASGAWDDWVRSVASTYEAAADVIQAHDALTGAEQEAAAARARIAKELAAVVDEALAEHIEASLQAAVRAASSLERRWWFWQSRRRRDAARDAAETLEALLRWVPEEMPLATAPQAEVFAAFTSILDALKARDAAGDARLHVGSLRTWPELDEELAARSGDRTSVGRRMVDSTWSQRLQHAPERSTAAAYARGLHRVAGGGRGVNSLRTHVPDVIAVFPAWGVTNLAAGTFLPLDHGLFDLVIIDEASQCDLPSAIPLLWRAKRAMIIGDPDQLTYISSLKPERDAALARRHGLDDTVAERLSYSAHSLFSVADRACGGSSIFLDRHYRSHQDIIAFSNKHVYGDRLEVVTDPGRFVQGPAVEWRHVAGRYRRNSRGASAMNEPEAHAAAELAAHLHTCYADASIGVVTPFRAQVERLRSLLAGRFPEAAPQILVDTAHGFQGDERDMIVFSPVVSDAMPAATISWASDRNLVNVALTRARARLVVVGDHDACLAAPGLIGQFAFWCDGRGFVV